MRARIPLYRYGKVTPQCRCGLEREVSACPLSVRLRIRRIASLLIGLTLATPFVVFALPVQCECVRWIRETQGVNIHGDAANLVGNIPEKTIDVGDVLLFHYGKEDHAALVIGFEGQVALPEQGVVIPKYILIHESNYYSCQESYRSISYFDPAIKGVLHIPSPSTSVL